jgi:hypothetical protein
VPVFSTRWSASPTPKSWPRDNSYGRLPRVGVLLKIWETTFVPGTLRSKRIGQRSRITPSSRRLAAVRSRFNARLHSGGRD